MKKSIILAFFFSCLLVAPQQLRAQTLEDYYNAGYILGASIRQAVDNSRARKAEQERLEMERLEAERRYELEQQRIANERYAIQQREAEARRAEEERLRIAQEARRAEEERLRIAQEAARAEEERLRLQSSGATRLKDNSVIENREDNKNVHVLTKDNLVSFLTDEGVPVYLEIGEVTDTNIDIAGFDTDLFVEVVRNSSLKDKDAIINNVNNSNDKEKTIRVMCDIYPQLETLITLIYPDRVERINKTALFYNNSYCNRELRLVCNNVNIKVRYVGNENEQSFTDACSISIPPQTYGDLEWSDVFFNISDTQQVESIKIQFIGTQIK